MYAIARGRVQSLAAACRPRSSARERQRELQRGLCHVPSPRTSRVLVEDGNIAASQSVDIFSHHLWRLSDI